MKRCGTEDLFLSFRNPFSVVANVYFILPAEPESPGWLWCRDSTGRSAWIHEDLLQPAPGETRRNRFRLKRNYDAVELSLSAGETVRLTESLDGFARVIDGGGRQGWLPLRNLKPLSGND